MGLDQADTQKDNLEITLALSSIYYANFFLFFPPEKITSEYSFAEMII